MKTLLFLLSLCFLFNVVFAQTQDLFVGFYYGFVLLIIIYTLLLYTRLKDTDHLIYACWVSLLGLVYSVQFGQLRDWLPAYYWFFHKHIVALAFLTAGAHILFYVSFLQLRRLSKTLYRLGIGLVLFFKIVPRLFSFFAIAYEC